jgi:hypothetical protein
MMVFGLFEMGLEVNGVVLVEDAVSCAFHLIGGKT